MNALLNSKLLWSLVLASGLVVALISLMPKPIDMDLDKVGNGQNALVFIYDPNLVASNEQAEQINSVRQLLGDQVNFLVAKTGDPKGEAFKRRFQANSLELLFFSRTGELLDRQFAVMSAGSLRAKLLELD